MEGIKPNKVLGQYWDFIKARAKLDDITIEAGAKDAPIATRRGR